MPLELNSLAGAVDALKRSVLAAGKDLKSLSPDLQDTVKAGIVQNFEVAYEQCWKFTQRWLIENRASAEAENPRTRKELFRMAARYGLISSPEPWFEFGEARNLTSHTYDKTQAEASYEAARSFLSHAEELLGNLKKKND